MGFKVFILIITSIIVAEKYTLSVKGLVCSFCAKAIEKKLKKFDGIESINIDLDNRLVILESSKQLDVEKIKEAIKEAGYTVANIKEE